MEDSAPVKVHQAADVTTHADAPSSPNKPLSSKSSRESLDPTAQFEDVIGVSEHRGDESQIPTVTSSNASDQSQTMQKKRSTLKRLFMMKEKRDELENDDFSTQSTESGRGRVSKMLHKVQSRASRVLEKMTPGHRGESGARSSSSDAATTKGSSTGVMGVEEGQGAAAMMTSSFPTQVTTGGDETGGAPAKTGAKSKTLRRIASGLTGLMAKGGAGGGKSSAASSPGANPNQLAVPVAQAASPIKD